MNRSGRCTAWAIWLMGRPLVLVASKASSGARGLASCQKIRLASRSSTMVSSISAQEPMQSRSRVKVIRPTAWAASSGASIPCAHSSSWFFKTVPLARSSPFCERLYKETCHPPWA